MKIETIIIPYDLPYGKNINFNPSILHIVDNVFLMAFHTYRRSIGYPRNYKVEPLVTDPYHMYYGGVRSETWWSVEDGRGEWGTGFLILKMIDNQLVLHS